MLCAALTSGDGEFIVAAITLSIVGYTTVVKGTKERRLNRTKAAEDRAAVEGREKLALEQIAEMAQEAVTILKGGGPPAWDGSTPPGLVNVVLDLKEEVKGHGLILKTLVPNGGNTNNTGDLVYRVAKEMGVAEEGDAHD